MGIRLSTSRYYEIPYSVFDVLLQMRGAVDPDSGQIVCHFHSIGVAALETPEGAVPAIVVDGCLIAVAGAQNVEAVLRSGDAVEVDSIRISKGRLMVGDVPMDSYWGLAALTYSREMGHGLRLYKLVVYFDEEPETVAAVEMLTLDETGPFLFLVPQDCTPLEEGEKITHI
ncbi:MAG: hypothetical protein ABWW70_03300 [Thermoproteota archaeon]